MLTDEMRRRILSLDIVGFVSTPAAEDAQRAEAAPSADSVSKNGFSKSGLLKSGQSKQGLMKRGLVKAGLCKIGLSHSETV